MDLDSSVYGAVLGELLDPNRQEDLGPGRPNVQIYTCLETLTPEKAFSQTGIADREMAKACLTGLWLHHNYLDQAHTISQSIKTPTGSFWHGIMHRREGDYSNAKYWFRRTGDHPIFLTLARRAVATSVWNDSRDTRTVLTSSKSWDPCTFVDLCRNSLAGRSDIKHFCQKMQSLEWDLLFDFCYRQAVCMNNSL